MVAHPAGARPESETLALEPRSVEPGSPRRRGSSANQRQPAPAATRSTGTRRDRFSTQAPLWISWTAGTSFANSPRTSCMSSSDGAGRATEAPIISGCGLPDPTWPVLVMAAISAVDGHLCLKAGRVHRTVLHGRGLPAAKMRRVVPGAGSTLRATTCRRARTISAPMTRGRGRRGLVAAGLDAAVVGPAAVGRVDHRCLKPQHALRIRAQHVGFRGGRG